MFEGVPSPGFSSSKTGWMVAIELGLVVQFLNEFQGMMPVQRARDRTGCGRS